MIEKPWTLKVEFTRGCNLACKFCPIYADPKAYEVKSYMSPALLDRFAQDYNKFKPDTRIELTLRGEPTLNPAAEYLLRILRRRIPLAQISMFTNGVKILKDPKLAQRLLDAGVNILNIDCYNGTYSRFQQLMEGEFKDTYVEIKDFRTFSAYKRHKHGERLKVVNLVPDIGDEDKLVAVRIIHNNAGNADPKMLKERWGIEPLAAPLQKRCNRPFREFVLYSDGTVPICCHDWKAVGVMGHYPEQTIEQIWYGQPHAGALAAIYDKDRSVAPCDVCNYSGGFRLGLLKDPRVNTTKESHA